MKAVIFDMGGVLINDSVIKEQAFTAFGVRDREQFWRLFNDAAMPACRGEESLSAAWLRMSKLLGLPLDEQRAKSLWVDDFEKSIFLDTDVLAIVEALRGKYKLGVVSNTVREHAEIIKRAGHYQWFDHLVLSYAVKMTKDNPDIFDFALKGLGVAAHECVFIDDVEKFALSAESKGMHSIVFKSAAQLKSDLEKLGVKVN